MHPVLIPLLPIPHGHISHKQLGGKVGYGVPVESKTNTFKGIPKGV